MRDLSPDALQKLAPAEKVDLLREMEVAIATLTSMPVSIQKPEVTVCVPAGPWALNWLWRALGSLLPIKQGVPLIVHATAQANALAEAGALEKGAMGWQYEGINEFKFVQVVPTGPNPIASICMSRKILAESVETPYTMFLDADVRCPDGGVKLMLDALKREPTLGIIGIQYAFVTDHIKMGCTMFRTEELKGFSWEPDKCECHALCMWYKHKGLDARHLEGISAEHRS